jgi:hypothetical protein
MVMRSSAPPSYRLSFLLPKGLSPRPGEYADWVPGCVVQIDGAQAVVLGPSRQRLFEQTARLVRVICHGKGPFSIAACLESPPPVAGRDGWTIIVGADVAFSPTAIGASFPQSVQEPRHVAAPALV